MTNNGERNALKGSREKITQPSLRQIAQSDTLVTTRSYRLKSPADEPEVPSQHLVFDLFDRFTTSIRDIRHESRKKSFKRDFCHVTLSRSTVNTALALGSNALRTNVLGERGIVCIAMTKERKSWNHYARHWGVEKCRTR
jgi:hypothetical protein